MHPARFLAPAPASSTSSHSFLKKSLVTALVPFLLIATGCTGRNQSASNDESMGQRAPAAVQGSDSEQFNPSDDPNLILPEPSSRAKTESSGTESGKSRKPASDRSPN